MSNNKRLSDTFTTYSFLSVLLVLILFVLFVYPAPEGILYSGLRILLILLVGVLFYQSLQPSRKLTQVEKIKKIQLINENFSIENGLLTPTMKVKRNKVIAKYKNILENFYKK